MISRPVKHAALPTFLQNHSVMRPGVDLADPANLDQFLRFSALFFRSLVVVDSDLNNNVIFHNAAQREDGLFWRAVQTGFLRRAARLHENGNLLAQAEVAEGLRKSSPARFDLIPAEYTAKLDATVSQAEAENPPLIWTRSDVNRVFSGKLLMLLKKAAGDQHRDAAQRDLIHTIAAWVSEQQRIGSVFGAADIETHLRPSAEHPNGPAWEAVWDIILEAQVGNIPLIFDGQLAVTGFPEANDRMLPGGPESDADENMIAGKIYAGVTGKDHVDIDVRLIDSQIPPLNIDMERLGALSLEQCEQLREAAEPDDLLEQRFRASGSGAQMTARKDRLRDAAVTFIERLIASGIALTEEAAKAKLRSDFWGPPGSNPMGLEIVAWAVRQEQVMEYTMLHSIPLPGQGPQVQICDFSSLVSRLDPELAQRLKGSGIKMYWRYARPDYRVIKSMAETWDS